MNKESSKPKNETMNKWISNELSAEKKQWKTRKREKNEEEFMLKNRVQKKQGLSDSYKQQSLVPH